jgi:hypothetical protein
MGQSRGTPHVQDCRTPPAKLLVESIGAASIRGVVPIEQAIPVSDWDATDLTVAVQSSRAQRLSDPGAPRER